MCAVIEITTTFMRNKNISSHQKYFTLAGQTILVWITVGYEIFQHVSECKRDGLLCCYFFGKLFASLCIVISYCTIFKQFYQKKTFTNLISNHKLIFLTNFSDHLNSNEKVLKTRNQTICWWINRYDFGWWSICFRSPKTRSCVKLWISNWKEIRTIIFRSFVISSVLKFIELTVFNFKVDLRISMIYNRQHHSNYKSTEIVESLRF